MTTPTWQSPCGRVSLYLGDCLDVLPTLGNVDCVVTSPPYNQLDDLPETGKGKPEPLLTLLKRILSALTIDELVLFREVDTDHPISSPRMHCAINVVLTIELHKKLKAKYWNVSRAIEDAMRRELGMEPDNTRKQLKART